MIATRAALALIMMTVGPLTSRLLSAAFDDLRCS